MNQSVTSTSLIGTHTDGIVDRANVLFAAVCLWVIHTLHLLHHGGPLMNFVLSAEAVCLSLLSSAPAVMRTSAQTFKDPSFE